MIILVGGEKGGTGKSTIAINLAVMHALEKKEVLVVDADKQGTTNFWSSLRNEYEIKPCIPCVQKFGKNIYIEIQDLAEKYETIIIDAGGRDSAELRASLLVADKFITPIRASQSDAWTLDHVDLLVTNARLINENLIAMIVVNQAPTNPSVSEVSEINEYLSDFENFRISKSIIKDRIALRHAFKDGLGCTEFKPKDKKAITELTSLYREVLEECKKKKVFKDQKS
ncbi:MAG: AAA family ATPase [Lentisphaerae bacterium]|nr:AAA family ATPase [Lentisphaerota bacterium]